MILIVKESKTKFAEFSKKIFVQKTSISNPFLPYLKTIDADPDKPNLQ